MPRLTSDRSMKVSVPFWSVMIALSPSILWALSAMILEPSFR